MTTARVTEPSAKTHGSSSRVTAVANSRGQGLIEFALVVVPLVFLLLGVLGLGFIWLEGIIVTEAAQRTARAAAVAPPAARCFTVDETCNGFLLNSYRDLLVSQCRATFGALFIASCSISHFTVSGVPITEATAQAIEGWLPLWGSFSPRRTVSYVDEGR